MLLVQYDHTVIHIRCHWVVVFSVPLPCTDVNSNSDPWRASANYYNGLAK